jgi:polyisoprenyl-phosphate glycosyltransferase
MNPSQVSIVVPCYNEQEVLPETSRRLLDVMDRLVQRGLANDASAIYYVDDGSRDRTWEVIAELSRSDSRIKGIKLSRNCGHQNALLAGLMSAPGDALVSIDADLQDDVNVIVQMVERYRAGAEVVYGVRSSRDSDTGFKRGTAEGYYKLMRRMGVDLVYNHADYRLMGRRAIDALAQFSEINLFLRGIVPLIGLRSEQVQYERAERFAGESKYPLRKMLAFAWQGITSFSVVPLRMITLLGFMVSLLSFAMILFTLYGRLVLGSVLPGWTSTVIPMYLLGGIQLLSIGILGEYVSKIYLESKRRPRYFIDRVI